MKKFVKLAALAAALAVTMLAASALSTDPADAGRRVKPPPSAGTCAVTPGSVALGSQYRIDGWGYTPGQIVNVRINLYQVWTLQADASGHWWSTGWASARGTLPVDVYDVSGRKPVYLNSCSFNVY